MIFNMVGPGWGGGGGTTLPTFDYSGTSEFVDDGNGNWRLFLKTSGDLRFSDLGNARRGIDVFLCGGGGSGGSGWYLSNTAGGGGGGGYPERAYEVKIAAKTVYPIVIGAGGARTTSGDADGNDG